METENNLKSSKAIFFAVMAAALYALMTPVSKLMQISVPPVMEAGLLYLGAGIGMTVIYFSEKCLGRKQLRPCCNLSSARQTALSAATPRGISPAPYGC
jgi:hypothetical protein